MNSIEAKLTRASILGLLLLMGFSLSFAQRNEIGKTPFLHYTVSMNDPGNHLFRVSLECREINQDTIDFRKPVWMPGYYQIMEYPGNVRNFSVTSSGKPLPFTKTNSNTWRVISGKTSSLTVKYEVFSDRKFVANNYLDATHAYIVPAATFMYICGKINVLVNVTVVPYSSWRNIATGLERTEKNSNSFTAPDFDILYDCPLLVGNLEELPSFTIDGINHRFIAYNPGDFNRQEFMSALEKTVKAAINIIGDIPYDEYTFIGIGPGAGGIEHLNNTTVSFSGRRLESPEGLKGMLKFLAHEYFHHYNVKRIRPYELGPFDYSREARTNLLWVSEGLTVYYEYLIVRRAEIINDEELFSSLEGDINAYENDPGREYQSLVQASYQTWSEGPFGNKLPGPDRSISFYNKGSVVGLILDLAIRNATQNEKSLDDVMRHLYFTYYKKLGRGFTDAEFQQACEEIAGISLSNEFEYVYTMRELDYSKYLSFAGLSISEETDSKTGRRKFTIARQDKPDLLQMAIYRSWSGQ